MAKCRVCNGGASKNGGARKGEEREANLGVPFSSDQPAGGAGLPILGPLCLDTFGISYQRENLVI